MFRNQLELQLYGLQRSGNHMLVTWIARHYEHPICFLNNVDIHDDPYTTYRKVSVDNTIHLPPKSASSDFIREIRLSEKQLLLYSYENCNISRVGDGPIVPDHQNMLGTSRCSKRVIMVRDFLNCLASKLLLMEKKGHDLTAFVSNIEAFIRLWLIYAREFVGETRYLRQDAQLVAISYNRFISDSSYRTEISHILELPQSVSQLHEIPIGSNPKVGVSSFGTQFMNKPTPISDLNHRWRLFNQPRFSILRDSLINNKGIINPYNIAIGASEWPAFEIIDRQRLAASE